MSFVSFSFIVFMAVTALVYFIVPQRFRWCVLLVGSLVFYWINSKWLIFVMSGTALLSFLFALRIEKVMDEGKRFLKDHAEILSREEKKAKKKETEKQVSGILTFGIILVLSVLVFLKYSDFLRMNVNRVTKLFGKKIPAVNFILPLGISFYSLQAIAYMVDVSRGKIRADRNFAKYLLFQSYFPQIVQGPIARHDQLAEQLYEGHLFDYSRFCDGVQLILWGFFKKLVIADRVSAAVNTLFGDYGSYEGLMIFFAAVLYGIQIYTDFSGGMEIARGFSQVVGIDLELNFNQPYFSCSIEEFWRRWHITLGSWMRDYVFYPLSLSARFGNLSKRSRKLLGNFIGKRLPSFLAMFIVYILVGWWHGSQLKYLAYGLWNGFFIMSGILLAGVYEKMRFFAHIDEDRFTWKVFKMIRTFTLVSIGRIFPRADSLKDALQMIRQMLISPFDMRCMLDGTLMKIGLNGSDWFLLSVSVIILFAAGVLHEKGIHIREGIARQHIVFRWCFYAAAVLTVLIFGVWGQAFTEASFIYQGF